MAPSNLSMPRAGSTSVTDAPHEFVSDSVERTIELGAQIGRTLRGGEIIALIGELGAGKTHLIKGVALGLAVTDPHNVTSPTFTLINKYPGWLPLYHVDAYRLKNAAELDAIGFDEICHPPAVVIVEWADRVWPLLQDYHPICIYLEHRDQYRRNIRLENLPPYLIEKIVP